MSFYHEARSNHSFVKRLDLTKKLREAGQFKKIFVSPVLSEPLKFTKLFESSGFAQLREAGQFKKIFVSLVLSKPLKFTKLFESSGFAQLFSRNG